METAVLALVGALIGALAGIAATIVSYRIAARNLIHEERESWRKLLIEACNGLNDAWLALWWLLEPAAKGRDLNEEAMGRLETVGERCAQSSGRVILLFGRGKDAGSAAAEVDRRIEAVKEAAGASVPWTELKDALDAAAEAHHQFQKEAHEAIEPSSWKDARWSKSPRRKPPTPRDPNRPSEMRGTVG